MPSIGKDYRIPGHDVRELMDMSGGDLRALKSPGLPDIHSKALSSPHTSEEQGQLIEAGRQFESYFISYLLKVMRDTVPQGAIGDKQGAYFYSLYDEEIGRRASETGGIGIAKMVEDYAKINLSSPAVPRSSFSG